MIARLEGRLCQLLPDTVILDVAGVGYEVRLSTSTAEALPAPGAPVTLFVHTHVREDQFTLYGFLSCEERALFRRLITVSGIGPRMALAILSGFPPPTLVQVVANEDVTQLSSIPGIGKKTAERIVIDLRDRLLKDHAQLLQMPTPSSMQHGMTAEALSALVNLGYPQARAITALQGITGHFDRVEDLLRSALKSLATS